MNKLPKRFFHGTTSNHVNSLKAGIDLNIKFANQYPDFGKGFYVTTQEDQANIQANRKTNMFNKPLLKKGLSDLVYPVVAEYELRIEEQHINKCKVFDSPDEEWCNFILSNRLNESYGDLNNLNQNLFLVFGPLADGSPNIGVLLSDFQQGKITHKQILQRIKPFYVGKNYQDQLSVHTDISKEWLKLKSIRAVK